MKRNLARIVPLIFIAAGCMTAADDGHEGIEITMKENGAVIAPAEQTELAPPVAARRPHRLESRNQVRNDDYYWLRDRENPEVIAYLDAENAYLDAIMKDSEALQETLYEEMVARIPQNDESVPTRDGGYYYYSRYQEGQEYPIYVRRKGSMDAAEEILLDANELAKGHEFFDVKGVSVSFNHDILAFATDTQGRRKYDLRFKDLRSGKTLPDVIDDVTANAAWAKDNRTIFYTRQDPDTLRWNQVFRHEVGTDPASDELVYQEDDETFSSFVYRTKSKEYIVIGSSQTMGDEYRILSADDPKGSFQIFVPRERGHEHSIEHAGDFFYIRTNDHAQNFRLMKTPEDATGRENWTEVIPHRADTFLAGFDVFRDHLVLSERSNALTHLRIIPWDGGGDHYISFDEPAYDVSFGENPEFDTDILRFKYTSMTTPTSTYDYEMSSRERELMKRDEVGGGFDPANYTTERVWATARDGVRIPVSIVYNKNVYEKDGDHPFLLYGYGSYGLSMDPTFNSSRLSLLDRGFGYAIAHIRGGQEMGREWYESGKLLNKKNTFTDFIDVGEFLIEQRYADPDELFAVGGSAGGLLMGAVVNMRPDLWAGIVAAVPFVDVVTTMLDDSIPLTTGEYDEWGNPNDPQYYDYILSYSPYDQVEAKDYPPMLVTTGLHDSQVQYWEPAKWVAKLRALKTDDNPLLMYTNMEAGHGGATGRFKKNRDTARMWAFLLGLTEKQ